MKDPNLLFEAALGELSLALIVCDLNRQALIHVNLLHRILLGNFSKKMSALAKGLVELDIHTHANKSRSPSYRL